VKRNNKEKGSCGKRDRERGVNNDMKKKTSVLMIICFILN